MPTNPPEPDTDATAQLAAAKRRIDAGWAAPGDRALVAGALLADARENFRITTSPEHHRAVEAELNADQDGTRYDIAEAGVIILRDEPGITERTAPLLRVGQSVYIENVHYRVRSIGRPRVIVDVERAHSQRFDEQGEP